MKLGEAKKRLEQIDSYLNDSLKSVLKGPLAGLGPTLENCNTLLKEKQDLSSRVEKTEVSTDLGGETINGVLRAINTLESKVALIENLFERDDLSDAQKQPLFEQLESYRSTRDNLRLSIEKCLWEIDVLDE